MKLSRIKFNVVYGILLLVLVYITAAYLDPTMTVAEYMDSVFGYVTFFICLFISLNIAIILNFHDGGK